MARRYEQITELYRQSIREITSRPENWTSFLRSACRNYRLPFDELVLIYAQRPDATAVLPIEGKNGWNKRFGRWVNRGATGIAVFDREYIHGTRLKYYFDISDTHESRFARPVPLWEVQPGQEADIIESLENSFGELENKENLAAALLSTAKNVVEDNMPDYLDDLLISREGSFLEELDDLNVEVAYRNALQASVGYIFLTRCGIHVDEYFEHEDFRVLLDFNTPETVNAIGVATRDIAEIGLAEISRTVRNLQRTAKKQNRTFAETSKARYAESTEKTNQPERSAEYGTDIYQSGRLSPAESDRAGGTGGTLGQIRLAPTFVSEKPSPDFVHESSHLGQAESTSAGDRGSGADPHGADRESDGSAGGRDGGTESQRPDGMGTQDERDPRLGGGNYPQGTDLQLTFLPTVEEQQNTIEAEEAAKAAEKSSAFSISQEDIDIILQGGINIENGKYRIYEQFQKSLSQRENADFLKEVYGIGGVPFGTEENRLEEWYDSKGIKISKGNISNPDASITLSWNKAAKRIAELIKLDRYLSAKEKAYYPTYLEQTEENRQRAAEAEAAREVLSRAPQENVPAKKENARYEYHLGDTVYLGAEEYEILAFDENEVRLFDVSFPLINKVLPRAEFDAKVRDNPMNDYLIAPEETEPPALLEAKRLINAYCMEEFEQEADFSDLHHVDLAMAGIHDGEHTVEISADLVDSRLVYQVDGETVSTISCKDLSDLNEYLANLDFDEMIAFAEEQYKNRQPASRADEMLRQAEQIAAASALPPEERFFLIETDDGYAIWDDLTEAIYVDDEGVSEEFTSEWQAQAYLEEVKKAVSDKQAAEWLAVERAKLPPLEYAAGDHFIVFSEDGRSSSEFVLTSVEENEIWYTFPDLPQQLPVSMRREEFENNLRSGHIREQPESRDYSNSYRLLDRLRKDCDYYLDAGERAEKHLWAGSVEKQIAKMRELFAALPEKPEWLSEQDINRYEQQMTVSDEILGKEISIDERRFVVESVHDGKASLRDLTFEESVGFPISRVENIDTVRRLLAEQEPQKQEEPVKLRSVVIDLTAPAQEETPAKKEELPAPPSARREKVSPFVLHPEIPSSERHNFRITDDHLGEGGAKTKFKNNVAAIRTLKEIEFDNRLATPEEQEILSRYVGWGGLPQAFDENNEQWADEFAELYGLLSPEEYEAARGTTLNAHYTSPTVIKAIYQAVENMGFRTGNVLEPSCGIGNFFGLVPESMKDSKLFGVELDSITGRIARQLYQQNSIAVQGFEDTELPDSFFDLAIGNVPFGSYSLHDKRYDKHHFLIHDYFFARTLDKVRPGGLIAFVTSKGTMDKQNPNVRKYIAERAELIGAIRLPNNAFYANAGTQVTTDIIFLQKREKLIDVSMPEADSGLEWLHLGQTENGVPINQYFIDHPEMVLGEMAFDDMMYGNAKETTCKPFEDESLSDLLAEAVQNLHAEYADYEIEDLEGEEEDKSIPADPNVRNFSFTLVDGAIYYRENSRMFPVEQSLTGQNRVKGVIAIRDCVRRLIEYQTESAPDEIVEREQRELNRLYDSFTAKYGLLNSRANTTAFSPDSSFPILCSLEVLDENGNLERKAAMFSKRTIKPYIAVSRVDTASEALAVSIGEKACVDLGFMASLMGGGSDRIEQIKCDLAGVISKTRNPATTPLRAGRPPTNTSPAGCGKS